MKKNAMRLWKRVVDAAVPNDQMMLVEVIVGDLAALFKKTGALPACRKIRVAGKNRDFIELSVYPVGNIGPRLAQLSELLADPEHRGSFHIAAANFVDVQPDDLSAGQNVPPKPGLLLSANSLPALIIGGEPDRLVLKMEGFERAVIGLTADLPGLWENVREAEGAHASASSNGRSILGPKTKKATQVAGHGQRHNKRQLRAFWHSAAGILGLVLPRMTVRPILVSRQVVENLGGGAVMVPVRGHKISAGAYPTRAAVDVLREALGVQTMLADHKLRAILNDVKRARELLESVLPKAYDHMRDIGKANLSAWTGYDHEREVQSEAQAKYADLVRTRREDGMRTEIEEVLAPLKLLSSALNHAERIVAAHDCAESVDTVEAAQIIEAAYEESRHSNLDANALFDIALHGDINPSMFWSVSDEAIVEILEAARVFGRVLRGARTVMSPPVLRVVHEGLFKLNLAGDHNEERIALRHRVATGMAAVLDTDLLKRLFGKNELTDQYVVIDRKSRKMKPVTAVKAHKILFARKTRFKWPF